MNNKEELIKDLERKLEFYMREYEKDNTHPRRKFYHWGQISVLRYVLMMLRDDEEENQNKDGYGK